MKLRIEPAHFDSFYWIMDSDQLAYEARFKQSGEINHHEFREESTLLEWLMNTEYPKTADIISGHEPGQD